MSDRRRSRSGVIVILLVATLILTAMLAYEAQQAARSHRATAETVLRDYAAFAAWELSRAGRTLMFGVINQELQEVRDGISRGGLDDRISRSCAAGCGDHYHIRTIFHAVLPEGQFSFAGEPAPAAVVELLAQLADDARRAPASFTCPGLRVLAAEGPPPVVVWRPEFSRGEIPIGIVGFVTDTAFIADLFGRLLKQSPLLPPSLMPEGENPNGALAVRVATAEGRELFASSADWSTYEGRESLPPELDALTLSVALRPDAAGALVIGGLPRERLPLVVGLLTLTAGLVVVALVQLRREAELSRLRSDFVSGVSHELRTPLAQIRLFTETLLLGRVRTPAEGRRSLEIIAREAQRLAQLVENVLLFARGDRRQPRIAREATCLAPVIRDVVECFAPLAAARQSRIVTHLDAAAAAQVDSGAIRQILLNLLDNAVKYGPAGQTITVAMTLHDERLRLAVEDEGPGVEPVDAERIWQPFSRLAHAATATGGTGIGLSIVRQLAELHNGRAWVESMPAGGRFVVEIPGAWSQTGASSAVA